jgi:hypothetical protein
MKMVKERIPTISTVNDERFQVLTSKIVLDGTIDHFEVFRNNVEVHYGQLVLPIYSTQVSRRLI